MTYTIRIERRTPPDGPPEEPYLTPRGYKMANPRIGPDRHHADHAIFVKTLDEVVAGLRRGFSLWMRQPGKRETLIRAASLKVSVA